MIKINQIELKNNDVYYFESLNDVIVTNNNYAGILILDNNLCIVDKVDVFDDFTIYNSFKRGNELLFHCIDNGYMVYIDVSLKKVKRIPLIGYENIIFSKFYEWNDEGIILSDYNGNFVMIDLNRERLIDLKTNEDDNAVIRCRYDRIKVEKICKINIDEKKVLFYGDAHELKLLQGENAAEEVIGFNIDNYHDFEIEGNNVLMIGEKKVNIIHDKISESIYASDTSIFLRGKIKKSRSEQYFLYLLLADLQNPNCVRIEKHRW